MRTLLAVLGDLLAFVLGRETSPGVESGLPRGATVPAIGDRDRGALGVGESTLPERARVKLPAPAGLAVPDTTPPADPESEGERESVVCGDTEYVSVSSATVQRYPYLAFDSVLAHLPYGTAVSVVRRVGRYAEVVYDGSTGFLELDALTADPAEVFPEFRSDEAYLADDPETVMLRRYIADAFSAAPLALPLQPGELVTYRLALAGRALPWGSARPRLPGQWQSLLRGQRGVSIGVTARTGSVMEYRDEEGTGYLAYVEAVTPEETLTTVAASADETGVYTKSTIPRAIWREWRPVFIVADIPSSRSVAETT
jgi:hypothetical protein